MLPSWVWCTSLQGVNLPASMSRPQHISAYNLSVEEGTKLNTLVEKGKLTVCDDETCLDMAALLRDKLRAAGYEQYEISNYALPGYHSRHNSSYWVQTPYLGLGPGAHSYDGQRQRTWNAPRVMEYLQGKRTEEKEILTDIDLYNERVMLGLRTQRGVKLSEEEWKKKKEIIEELIQRDLVREVTTPFPHLGERAGDRGLSLTEKGQALGDEVIRELMQDSPESQE